MSEIARIVSTKKVVGVDGFENGLLVIKDKLYGLATLRECTVLTDHEPLMRAINLLPNAKTIKILPLKPESLIEPMEVMKPKEAPLKETVELDNDSGSLVLSHSGINTFRTCPRQFQHVYILKDVERTTCDAAVWGVKIHKQLEDFLQDNIPVVDDMAKRELPYIQNVREKFLVRLEKVEFKWGLTKDWLGTDFFNKENAFIRGIIDWLVVSGEKAIITDHKTGTKKADDFYQMDIFALAVFCIYPQVKKIRGVYFWLKEGDTPTHRDYVREDLEKLKESLMIEVNKIKEVDEVGIWPMRTSGLCYGWCPVKKCPSYKEKKGK